MRIALTIFQKLEILRNKMTTLNITMIFSSSDSFSNFQKGELSPQGIVLIDFLYWYEILRGDKVV
jgi:hypothetical protein